MDEPAGGPASETGDEPDAGGAADVELPLASAATPVAAVGTSRVSAVDVEPRGGGFGRVLLGLFVILIVLAIGVGLGFGAAALVPSFVDASPPTVTLAPATERPTPPPVPTERPTPSPSPTPSPVPSPTPLVHTVRRGENLTQIANRYDVTVEAVVAANGIKNANLIEVGQKLIIPQPSPEP
jgi:nucleoid-associated protein YgaU